jgi:UDP-N-acetylmuramoyl-tripeptide--D-alanyl-D-alanine ligase
MNALAAITLTTRLGASREAVRAGLEAARPLFGRSQVVHGPVTLLVDCYNSNPESLRSALSFVAGLRWRGRKLVVLGSMLELGREGPKAHEDAGRYAATLGLDAFFVLGEEMRRFRDGLFQVHPEATCLYHETIEDLTRVVSGAVRTGDLVLIKGSRGVALERLVEPLKNAAA